MRLIVETDIGHDPDDFFAITYLLAAGVDIAAIVITPGDPDQIAIARLITTTLGLDIPIGVSKLARAKLSSGSIHHDLLKQYGRSLQEEPDGLGVDIIKRLIRPATEAFIIGPVSSIGAFLKENPSGFARATMQGGFAPYSLHRSAAPVAGFEGKHYMPTFNLNGDRKAAETFLNAPIRRQMVGKNVCHAVLFDKARFATFTSSTNPAAALFHQAANLYFTHHDSKKFHDPIAAVCHLHPEVGTWFKGKSVKERDGWTTVPGEDDVLVDLDHDKAWEYLRTLS